MYQSKGNDDQIFRHNRCSHSSEKFLVDGICGIHYNILALDYEFYRRRYKFVAAF